MGAVANAGALFARIKNHVYTFFVQMIVLILSID